MCAATTLSYLRVDGFAILAMNYAFIPIKNVLSSKCWYCNLVTRSQINMV